MELKKNCILHLDCPYVFLIDAIKIEFKKRATSHHFYLIKIFWLGKSSDPVHVDPGMAAFSLDIY